MLHSLTPLQRVDLLDPVEASHQHVQHRRLAVQRSRRDRSLAHNRQLVHVLAPRHMTERRRRNRSGMAPPGLVPTPVRIGRSIHASTPTPANMDPSIEREGDDLFGERRANAPQRSLLRVLKRQRRGAWRDPPRLPLVPPHSFSLRCW